MILDVHERIKNAVSPKRCVIKKRGTIQMDCVESTPVVWKGQLYRFEWRRNNNSWDRQKENATGEKPCYRFVNVETNQAMPDFGFDHSFGCCYEENGVMYVHGGRGGEGAGRYMDVFWSEDLIHWQCKQALELPEGLGLYNTSVCKDDEGYVIALEVNGPNPIAGSAWTIIYAKSKNLFDWELMSPEHKFRPGCPTLRYFDGYYYLTYLQGCPVTCQRWLTYIVRSKDLIDYEVGIINPFMFFDDGDKVIQHPENFTPQDIEYIQNAVNCNNSDVDYCDYNGKTIITYSWGNQHGNEFLADAVYDGSLEQLMKSFF